MENPIEIMGKSDWCPVQMFPSTHGLDGFDGFFRAGAGVFPIFSRKYWGVWDDCGDLMR